jgi:hypothetical protein
VVLAGKSWSASLVQPVPAPFCSVCAASAPKALRLAQVRGRRAFTDAAIRHSCEDLPTCSTALCACPRLTSSTSKTSDLLVDNVHTTSLPRPPISIPAALYILPFLSFEYHLHPAILPCSRHFRQMLMLFLID